MEFIQNTLGNIFTSDPGQAFRYYIPMLILAGGLLVGSIVFSKIYDSKKKNDFAYKKLFKNLSKSMALFGGLFLLLTGLRYESIPYFSMRLWLYISILTFLYVAYRYIKKFRKDYPREKQNVHHLIQSKQKEKIIYSTKKKKKH